MDRLSRMSNTLRNVVADGRSLPYGNRTMRSVFVLIDCRGGA